MIYFIQDSKSKYIKIGFSCNPVERLASLQTAHHSKLVLIAVMDGTQATERSIHDLFTKKKQGEWFEPSRDLIAFIKQRTIPVALTSEDQLKKTKRKADFPDFKPELLGNTLPQIIARFAVYKKWSEIDILETIDLLYPHCIIATDRLLSREEIKAEVDRLVAIQNADTYILI